MKNETPMMEKTIDGKTYSTPIWLNNEVISLISMINAADEARMNLSGNQSAAMAKRMLKYINEQQYKPRMDIESTIKWIPMPSPDFDVESFKEEWCNAILESYKIPIELFGSK